MTHVVEVKLKRRNPIIAAFRCYAAARKCGLSRRVSGLYGVIPLRIWLSRYV